LNFRRSHVAFLLVVAAPVLIYCGGSTGNPVGVITPTPTTAPTPVPTATPFVCPLGKSTANAETDCVLTKKADATTFNAVVLAVNNTIDENPTWFTRDELGRYRLKGDNRYQMFLTVVDKLNSRGFCSFDDDHGQPGDGQEIAVKRTNDFSEQYKFWVTGCPKCGLDNGIIRTDSTMHVATCRPASF
jgi:hypothetical protein